MINIRYNKFKMSQWFFTPDDKYTSTNDSNTRQAVNTLLNSDSFWTSWNKDSFERDLNKSTINKPVRYMNHGMTLLHVAVEKGNSEAVEALLKKGADKNVTDVFGKTPFDRAVAKNDTKIINLLSTDTVLQRKVKNLEQELDTFTELYHTSENKRKRLEMENSSLKANVEKLKLKREDLVRVNKKLRTEAKLYTERYEKLKKMMRK